MTEQKIGAKKTDYCQKQIKASRRCVNGFPE